MVGGETVTAQLLTNTFVKLLFANTVFSNSMFVIRGFPPAFANGCFEQQKGHTVSDVPKCFRVLRFLG